MSQQLWVVQIDWNNRTAGLSLEPDSTDELCRAPFSALVFPEGWTCGEPECGLPVRLSWAWERGYERGQFPGRCKAKRVAGVSDPGRRMLALLGEQSMKLWFRSNHTTTRYQRLQVRRAAAVKARVKQGLLPKRLRP